MVDYDQIAAEAAELARQFWLEIEAEFTRQVAQYRGSGPARAGIPGDSRPRDDQPLPSADRTEPQASPNKQS